MTASKLVNSSEPFFWSGCGQTGKNDVEAWGGGGSCLFYGHLRLKTGQALSISFGDFMVSVTVP